MSLETLQTENIFDFSVLRIIIKIFKKKKNDFYPSSQYLYSQYSCYKTDNVDTVQNV